VLSVVDASTTCPDFPIISGVNNREAQHDIICHSERSEESKKMLRQAQHDNKSSAWQTTETQSSQRFFKKDEDKQLRKTS